MYAHILNISLKCLRNNFKIYKIHAYNGIFTNQFEQSMDKIKLTIVKNSHLLRKCVGFFQKALVTTFNIQNGWVVSLDSEKSARSASVYVC